MATVLHVSEAFGGGVVSAVTAHVEASPEFRHVLAFSDRPEAPLSGHDLDPFEYVVALPTAPIAAIRTIRRILRTRSIDVVHAHSAVGGALARLAARATRVPVVYSPHCFAHLRKDQSRAARASFRMAERFLSRNTAVYAACSPFELQQSKAIGSKVARVYVPNAVSAESQPPTDGDISHVVGVGRLCPQKDPEFFVRSVQAIRAAGIEVEASWIGDGDPALRKRLENADIEVTGWLPRDESLRRLAQPGGVYLHSALWEGFPYAILEAHAAGLPMVIRHIPTMADFAFPYEVREPADVAQAVKELYAADAREHAVSGAADALADNNRGLLRERLLEAYRLAMEPQKALRP